jgi:hypothetical protein
MLMQSSVEGGSRDYGSQLAARGIRKLDNLGSLGCFVFHQASLSERLAQNEVK